MNMLWTAIVVGIVLITANLWFSFLMQAGVITFWSTVSLLTGAFIIGVYNNQYLLLAPVLFFLIVMLYGVLYYRLADRPRLGMYKRQYSANAH